VTGNGLPTSTAVSIATAATATATATTPAIFARTGFIDRYRSAGDLLHVQTVDGLLAGLVVVHFHEAESARAAGVSILDDIDGFHVAVLGEGLLNVRFGRVEAKVTNINVHGKTPAKVTLESGVPEVIYVLIQGALSNRWHPRVKYYPAQRRQAYFQPWALEQSAGSTRGKPERLRKKARSDTKIQLDRYKNNLSKCALTKSSRNRPGSLPTVNAHAV